MEERAAGFLAALEKAQAENADLTDRLGGVENHHEAAQEELSRRAEAAQAAREELSAALAETDALREQLESVSLAAAEEKVDGRHTAPTLFSLNLNVHPQS